MEDSSEGGVQWCDSEVTELWRLDILVPVIRRHIKENKKRKNEAN